MDKVLRSIKSFDAYPKTLEDFRVRTTSGAAVSIIAGIFILWLFISEFSYYLNVEVKPELFVDTTRGEKLRINFDITFHNMPCASLSVDAMDMTGSHQLDVYPNIFKTRLDKNGVPISGASVEKDTLARDKPDIKKSEEGEDKSGGGEGTALEKKEECQSCYGAEEYEGQCCNTCEEVQEAYRKKGWAFTNPEGISQCVKEGFSQKLQDQKNEACKIYGYLLVNKVAGNMHVAPGKSFQKDHMHVHDLSVYKFTGFNLSHTINKLSFGTEFPGVVNPLDGAVKIWDKDKDAPMFEYFVKIVPTIYKHLDGEEINTNQFSVTEHTRVLTQGNMHGLPGVFFMYDLSPIMVQFTETQKSFAHFLTGICAIIGGVFTVAGIIDGFIYQGLRSFKKKVELGKAS